MQNGNVALTLETGGIVKHAVAMNKIVQQTITKVNGETFQRMIYNVMDPALGYYRNIDLRMVLRVFNLY